MQQQTHLKGKPVCHQLLLKRAEPLCGGKSDVLCALFSVHRFTVTLHCFWLQWAPNKRCEQAKEPRMSQDEEDKAPVCSWAWSTASHPEAETKQIWKARIKVTYEVGPSVLPLPMGAHKGIHRHREGNGSYDTPSPWHLHPPTLTLGNLAPTIYCTHVQGNQNCYPLPLHSNGKYLYQL